MDHIPGAKGTYNAAVLVEGHGYILHYPAIPAFIAYCTVRHADGSTHGRCIKQCSSERGRGKKKHGGRPLGFLMAWLGCNKHDDCKTKAAHWDWANLPLSFASRKACRQILKGTAQGRELLSKERPQGTDPDSEPEDLESYL